jgi:hypothetical protein
MLTVHALQALARHRIERGNVVKMVTVRAPVASALHQAIRLRICIRPYIQILGEEAVGVLERLHTPGLLGHRPASGAQTQMHRLPAYVSIRQQ